AERARAVAALRQLLAAVAQRTPVVLRVEDLQWSDRDSRDLLIGLLRPPTPAGLLVLASLRTSEDSGDPHLTRMLTTMERAGMCRRVALGPLHSGELSELRARMRAEAARTQSASGAAAPAWPRWIDDDGLWQEIDGHPLLLSQLLSCAREAPHELVTAAELGLDQVIWRRLSRLEPISRQLLILIAVAGEPTPLGVLAQAGELSPCQCQRAMRALCAAGLTRWTTAALECAGPAMSGSGATASPGSGAAACTGSGAAACIGSDGEAWVDIYHGKIAEAVCERLSPVQRATGHGRLAGALEAWGRASATALAEHWLAAGDSARAIGHLLDGAERAADKLAVEQASALFRRTLAELPGSPAASSPRSVADRDLAIMRCRAWLGLVRCLRLTERGDEAMPMLDRAERLAEEHRLAGELAAVHYLRGCLLFPTGDFAGCIAQHEHSLAYARWNGSVADEARALSGLGDAHLIRGRMLSAHVQFDRCVTLSRQHDLTGIEASNLPVRGWTRYYRMELEAAGRDCAEGVELAVRIGHRRAELVARAWLGFVLTELGLMTEAMRQLDSALDIARLSGIRRFEQSLRILLGRAMAAAGLRDEALTLLREVAGRERRGAGAPLG
ncbi:MAG: hypothetical protein AAGC55_21265, partial [Myxococcota bacterium]